MREHRLIQAAIRQNALDLEGFTVFTEAATGPFLWTAILALAAGARKVYAIAKDSRYGRAVDVLEATQREAASLGLASRIQPTLTLNDLGDADIVTNLGALRPFNQARVAAMAPAAVLPLMWETWEHRPEDLDLEACERRGILVLGTDEAHPDLAYLDHVGLLVLKLLLEAGIEVRHSPILLLGGGAFASATLRTLLPLGANLRIACLEAHLPTGQGGRWLGTNLDESAVLAFLAEAEALVILEHHRPDLLLGSSTALTVEALARVNPELRIIHISGLVEEAAIRQAGFTLPAYPLACKPRTMSLTPAWLGPRPVIDLHSAGLKVGEVMARARRQHPQDLSAARRLAMQHPLCQDFHPTQYPPSREHL
jgi:hypothetical protein